MNTRELMIGDWLQHTNGQYFRITRIDMYGDGEVHFACGQPHLWDYNNKFSPIPITAEILEKNGFEPQGYPGWMISENNSRKRILVQEAYDGYELHIDYMEAPFCKLSITIHYVHELQHALRLCRVEKEIEL